MARFLMLAGVVLVAAGLMIHYKVEIPWITSWIGKLPGDMVIKKGKMTLYFPITTSILVSIVLSLVLSVLFKNSK